MCELPETEVNLEETSRDLLRNDSLTDRPWFLLWFVYYIRRSKESCGHSIFHIAQGIFQRLSWYPCRKDGETGWMKR